MTNAMTLECSTCAFTSTYLADDLSFFHIDKLQFFIANKIEFRIISLKTIFVCIIYPHYLADFIL